MNREELNQLLVKVAADSQIGVIITDSKGETVWVNDHIKRITGFSSTEFIGRTPGSLLQGPDTNPDHVEAIRKGLVSGQAFETEILNYTKDGGKFWVNLQIDPVRNVQNKIEFFLSIQHDISDLKEKNEQLENFNYLTTHDLINQVGNLHNLIHMMSDKHMNERELKKLDILKISANKLKKTATDLRSMLTLKGKDLELGEIRLDELIGDVCETLRKEIKAGEVTVERRISKTHTVVSNRLYLSSICYNLISNAIKYKDPEKDARLSISCKIVKGVLNIVFEDNGLGIDLGKNKDKVFQAFKTFHSNPDAIGIGLYITKKQVEALNGSIDLKSKLGIGSTFSITLPH